MSYAEDYGIDIADADDFAEGGFLHNYVNKYVREEELSFYKQKRFWLKRELELRKVGKHTKSKRLWNAKPIRKMTEKHIENTIKYLTRVINKLLLDDLFDDILDVYEDD